MTETKVKGILSPRNRNMPDLNGLGKSKLSPKKIQPKTPDERCTRVPYHPLSISRRYDADNERKASFNKARSVFTGSAVCAEKSKFEVKRKATLETRELSSPFKPILAGKQSKGPNRYSNCSLPQGPSREELLSKYASKQAELMDIKRRKDLLEFEILELQTQLQMNISPDNFVDSIYAKASNEVQALKGKVSMFFETGPESRSLKKTASMVFNIPTSVQEKTTDLRNSTFNPTTPKAKSPPADFSASLRKTASSLFSSPTKFTPNKDLKKKASAVFNTKFVFDVREKLDQQQNEIEELTKKGTQFARDLISSLSAKKESELAYTDTSLVFENVANISVIDRSILLSDDEDDEVYDEVYDEHGLLSVSSNIHIDDYDSEASSSG